MPRQRAVGRRGALRRSVLVLGLVVFMIALWLGASWLRFVADERAAEQGRQCPNGPTTLKVTVAPAVEEPLREIAGRWNTSGPVVDDFCVRVTIAATESGPMLAGLTGEWNARELGDRPHAWLPESSFWTDRLSAVDDALLGSAPDTVASSPVVLATPEPAAKALTDTATFTWTDVATLIPDPSGWSRYGQSAWGRLIVALPAPAANPATGLAVQAVLSGVGKQSPLTHEVLERPEITEAISRLTAGQPTGVPETTREALISLGEAESMTTAPFSAVPVLEVDLHRRNLAVDGRPAAKRPLFAVMPDGPIPTADFPFVRLAGIDGALANAADRFRQFLLEPDQQRSLGRAGLRTASNERPPSTLGITWPELPPATPPANPRTTQQLAATWAAAAEGGRIVTMLVDVSKSMGDDNGDGRTRMQWVQEALHGYADYTVSGSLGLWQFAQSVGRAKPYQQLVATGPIGDTRALLHQAVDTLAPTGTTHLYESVAAAYRAAVSGHVAGKRNEIVVITDGGSEGAMTLAELSAAIKAAGNGKKQVVVSVIAFGPDQNRAALRDIAKLTGGTVSTLSSARGLQAALGQLAARRD